MHWIIHYVVNDLAPNFLIAKYTNMLPHKFNWQKLSLSTKNVYDYCYITVFQNIHLARGEFMMPSSSFKDKFSLTAAEEKLWMCDTVPLQYVQGN